MFIVKRQVNRCTMLMSLSFYLAVNAVYVEADEILICYLMLIFCVIYCFWHTLFCTLRCLAGNLYQWAIISCFSFFFFLQTGSEFMFFAGFFAFTSVAGDANYCT